MQCGVCGAEASVFTVIDQFEYGDCTACGSLAVDARVIAEIDGGKALRSYDTDYWRSELAAARERAYGAGLARVAEAVLYTSRPIEKFIDIGCGPGYLLDALAAYLPARSLFYGVERFPPPDHTRHQNYRVGGLSDLDFMCDSGVCIEVLEHLTPRMAGHLASDLAARSRPGALYLFNTGMPQFVKSEDPGYLDPVGRGHIVSWGEAALRNLFEPLGFRVHRARSWAFAVEFQPFDDRALADRIWNSPNASMLRDPVMGDLMFLVGRESARVYA